MSKISIVDLEVFYAIGVSDEERAKPQRLLISVDLQFDFSSASLSDRIEKTIDYNEIAQDLLRFGKGRSWKLLEKLVATLADRIFIEYRPQSVTVEVKKFSIPQTRHVAVSLTRTRER
jgi:7,8-dihydroneopterin aldolase/epimerase/oxygenase